MTGREWRVYEETAGVLMPEMYSAREDAEGYRQWLYGRKFEGLILMLDEQRHDYPEGSNENSYRWFRSSPTISFGPTAPLRDAKYTIVSREIGPWERA